MAKKNVQLVMDLAAKFIAKHKGEWNHGQWEDLVKDAEKDGLPMGEEGRRNLGLILEAGRFFLHASPKSATKKPKDKAKDKDKVKEKKKPKSEVSIDVKVPKPAPAKPAVAEPKKTV